MKKTFKTIEDLENALMEPVTPEEQKEREEKAEEIKAKEWIEEFEKKPNVMKNHDGSYNVDGNVNLSQKNIKKLPVKFNIVKGSFLCYNNYLTSLEGAPNKVGGTFTCWNNQLTSLEGAPKEVGGDFWCGYNQLTSLEDAPKEVGENFECHNNPGKFTEEDVRKVCNVKGKIYV